MAMLADLGLAAQLEDGRSHASLGGVCGTTGCKANYVVSVCTQRPCYLLCVCHVRAYMVPTWHIDLHLRTPPYRYIDPLLNDSVQASTVTDGYAVGVTLLQVLTGRPVANLKVLFRTNPNLNSNPNPNPNPNPRPNLKVVCRKLLRLPGRPDEWEAPGVADRGAGAWPVPLQVAVACVVSGLVFAPVRSVHMAHPMSVDP